MASRNFFSSEHIVLASMHGKEAAIASVLEQRLGWKVSAAKGLDTDAFGAFSGEVERRGTPLEAARAKAQAAMALSGASMALASEGTFGPHPALYFVPSDHELLLLMDRERGIELHASVLSLSTNFAQQVVGNFEELAEFARAAGFPEHRLLLRTEGAIIKGIGDWQGLEQAFSRLAQSAGPIQAETDMRAMYNPTRMAVIAQAAEALADKLLSACPACQGPGFEAVEPIPGLVCSLCQIPTTLPRAHIWSCTWCGFREEKLRPDGLQYADPAHCPWCNP